MKKLKSYNEKEYFENSISICKNKEQDDWKNNQKDLINKTDILEVIKIMNFENNDTLDEIIEDYDGLLILSDKAYRNYKKGNVGNKFKTLLENNKIFVIKYELPNIVKNNSSQLVFQSGIFLSTINKWDYSYCLPLFRLLFYFEIKQKTLSFKAGFIFDIEFENIPFDKWETNINEVLETENLKIINNEFKYNKREEEDNDDFSTIWNPQSGKGYSFYKSFWSWVNSQNLQLVGFDETEIKNNLLKDFEDIYFLHIVNNSISYILIEFFIDDYSGFGKKATIKEFNGELSFKSLKNFGCN